MRTALALVLAASMAHAADDAPLAQERLAQMFRAGEIVPFDGVCMTDGKAVEVGKRIVSCEAEMAVVETKTVITTSVLVGGIVAIVALSFAAGAATAYAVKK